MEGGDSDKPFKFEDITEHEGRAGEMVLFWQDTWHCGARYRSEEGEAEDEDEGEAESERPDERSVLEVDKHCTCHDDFASDPCPVLDHVHPNSIEESNAKRRKV